MAPERAILIRVGTAVQTFPSEAECGDQCCVRFCDDGVLLGVVDGLGHGAPAARAAGAVIRELESRSREGLSDLALRCHHRLRGTRGAVMGLAFLPAQGRTLVWLGVGNVQGILVREGPESRRSSLASTRGLLGHRLDDLRPYSLTISRGDVLMVATDGVRRDFVGEIPRGEPGEAARRILSKHATGADDALVLVARYLG